MRFFVSIVLLSCSLLGCVKRTILVTTNPPGALVWVNDREVGRTPVSFPFTFHGEYDVRIERVGNEPIMTAAWTNRPMWDAPLVDLFAELAPFNLHAETVWHYDLAPLNNNPEQLLERANALRTYTQSVTNE
ncbi:MAG: PEGA domain-containing protein [Phycisphaerales bacterium]|jgi:hypothetical protein